MGRYAVESQRSGAGRQQGVSSFLSRAARVSRLAVKSNVKLPHAEKIIDGTCQRMGRKRFVFRGKGQMNRGEEISVIEMPPVDDGSGSKKSFFGRLKINLILPRKSSRLERIRSASPMPIAA